MPLNAYCKDPIVSLIYSEKIPNPVAAGGGGEMKQYIFHDNSVCLVGFLMIHLG